jgi:5,10-methenyltetrahydrofolate synthetase
MDSTFKQLQRQLSSCDGAILFAPLKNEVDFSELPFFKNIINAVTLPNIKESNPDVIAKNCMKIFGKKKVYILIPGKMFDQFGTRYGHGLGWYDKFLSQVPKDWIRIGVASESQLSDKKLKRETWDQPVDWLIIKTPTFWRVYETETRVNKN